MNENPSGRSVEVNGGTLYYEEHGDGAPLILIHGGLYTSSQWEPVVPELVADGIREISAGQPRPTMSGGNDQMLKHGSVATRLPAQNLERARAFYAEKLGLEPIEERKGGLRYVCAAGEFALFKSAGTASGDHTQMGWEVEDIEATVRELRARGVVFEEYDFTGLRTVEGIADIEGNYPSKGSGERGAWFRDSEGNMLGIGQRWWLRDQGVEPLSLNANSDRLGSRGTRS